MGHSRSAVRLADAAVSAELESGLLRKAGVPERAAARIHEACTRHLLGWRGGLNIFTGRWVRRLFLFLSYILCCYILSAIFILFYPYYPLQPAEKLRRFRMCGINLRAACIGGGRPCRASRFSGRGGWSCVQSWDFRPGTSCWRSARGQTPPMP